jgi:hypothetical protein
MHQPRRGTAPGLMLLVRIGRWHLGEDRRFFTGLATVTHGTLMTQMRQMLTVRAATNLRAST